VPQVNESNYVEPFKELILPEKMMKKGGKGSKRRGKERGRKFMEKIFQACVSYWCVRQLLPTSAGFYDRGPSCHPCQLVLRCKVDDSRYMLDINKYVPSPSGPPTTISEVQREPLFPIGYSEG